MYDVESCISLYTYSIGIGIILSAIPYLVGIVINAIFKILKVQLINVNN